MFYLHSMGVLLHSVVGLNLLFLYYVLGGHQLEWFICLA